MLSKPCLPKTWIIAKFGHYSYQTLEVRHEIGFHTTYQDTTSTSLDN